MTTTLTREDLVDAARQLGRSARGRSSMLGLVHWLEQGALGLDQHNKRAVLTLLEGAFGSYSMTAREVMYEFLESGPSR